MCAVQPRPQPKRTADGRWVPKCDFEQVRQLVVGQGKGIREAARLLAQPFSTVQGICQRRNWKPGQQPLAQTVRYGNGHDPHHETAEIVKLEVARFVECLQHSRNEVKRADAASDLVYEGYEEVTCTALPALLKATLEDPSGWVRDSALRAICAIESRRVSCLPPLAELRTSCEFVAQATTEAALAQALHHPEPSVSSYASRTLAALGKVK